MDYKGISEAEPVGPRKIEIKIIIIVESIKNNYYNFTDEEILYTNKTRRPI